MRFKFFTLPLLAVLTLGGCSVDEDSIRRPLPEPTEMRGPGKVAPGVILVKMQNEPEDPMQLAAALPELKIKNVERMFTGPAKFEARKRAMGLHLWYRVTFEESVPVTRAAADITASGGIQEINYVHEIYYNDAPETWPFDDPSLPDQWHYMNFTESMNSVPGSDINLFPAWEITTGSPDVIVAVLDGGVDWDHEDLAWNMWTNEAELNGQPGVDDDGNGFVDDIHGFNFTDKNNGYAGALSAEDHGTHVAGTIAAVNNNGIGVSGIAGGDYANGKPGVRIMSCQTSPGEAYIAEAFVYAADNGAVISQNSWGCDPSYTVVLETIEYFNTYAGKDENGNQVGPMAGGLTVFAAGNSSSTTKDVYPADYENVLAVASVGADYEAAYYTNYGDWVDVSAPGGDTKKRQEVLSTIPDNQYGKMQGTSMACPHVSGVAALVVSEFGGPGFTREQLWNILVTGVRDIDQYNPNHAGRLGSGLIDAYLCLNGYGIEPPMPVTDLRPTEALGIGSNAIELEWTVPEDEDSGQPYYFDIFYSTASLENLDPEDFDESTVTRVRVQNDGLKAGETMTYTVTGLQMTTTYYFRMQSIDNVFSASPLSEQYVFTTLDNIAPEISPLDGTDTTIRCYQNISLRFQLSDRDGDELTAVLTEAGSEAAGLSRSENIVALNINGLNAPKTDAPATYTAVITVSDGKAETSQEVHYTILPNAAPQLLAAPEPLCLDGVGSSSVVDLTAVFSDPDGETLMYNVSSSDEGSILGLSVSGNNLTVSAAALGQGDVKVEAYDAAGETCSVTFQVVARDGSRLADFYPNPVTDFLNIRTGEASSSASVQVLAPNGATVLTGSDLTVSPFAPVQIDMTALPGGMYTVILSYTAADGSTKSTTTDIAKL